MRGLFAGVAGVRRARVEIIPPSARFARLSTQELLRAYFACDDLLYMVRANDEVAAIEAELVDAIVKEFEDRFPAAADAARAAIEEVGLRELFEEGDLQRVLEAIEGPLAEGLEKAIAAPVQAAIDGSYLGGRGKILKPFGIEPSFNLTDEHAQGVLRRDTMYWIGSSYGNHVGPMIADVVRKEVIEQGLSRLDGADRLAELFGADFPDRSIHYWRVVSAAAVVRSHTFGNVESFVQAGVRTYILRNPNDARTSDVCRYLDGKEFDVSVAVSRRDAFLAAEDPDEAKGAMPWVKKADVDGLDSSALAAANVALPPFHGRCRTIVVPKDFG